MKHLEERRQNARLKRDEEAENKKSIQRQR
jgi:hypothetical protein